MKMLFVTYFKNFFSTYMLLLLFIYLTTAVL